MSPPPPILFFSVDHSKAVPLLQFFYVCYQLLQICRLCFDIVSFSLRKHAFSNILKILPPKNENFQIKNSVIFYNSAPNINCGYSSEQPRRGGSNEYHNLCFCAEIR